MIKQSIAEYNRNCVLSFIAFVSSLFIGIALRFQASFMKPVLGEHWIIASLEIFVYLLWIFSAIFGISSLYYFKKADELREKLRKGIIK